MKNKSIDMNVSFIRILATLLVLMVHTCSTIVTNPDLFSFTVIQSKFMYVLYRLSICAVPLFFMISGKLLLSSKKELTYSVVFSKYVKRLLLALAIFSLPMAALKIFLETKSLMPVRIIKAFFCNESFSHFWYLYTLLAIYFVLPILKNVVRSSDNRTLMVFLCLLGVFDFVVPTIAALTGWKIAFFIPFSYSVFYFVAGYFVSIMPKRTIYFRVAAVSSLISGCVIVAMICLNIGTGLLGKRENLPVAVFSLANYYMLANLRLPDLSEKMSEAIWKTDRLCFGVYLIHPIFIQFTYRLLRVTPCDFTLYPIVTFMFFAAFSILSFAISFLMSLIPWLRKNVL